MICYNDLKNFFSGLACHPRRPFLVASTSRDSTVRLWSLSSLAYPMSLSILAQRRHDEIFAKNIGMFSLSKM